MRKENTTNENGYYLLWLGSNRLDAKAIQKLTVKSVRIRRQCNEYMTLISRSQALMIRFLRELISAEFG
jgi:hypothetical protein